MTETLTRSARTAATPPPARRPLEAGLTAAVWAVGAGLVAIALPVLLVWAADARSGAEAGTAMRTAGQVWLAAHGVGLHVPGGTLGVTPLGLLLVPLALLVRAGSHTARECRVTSLRDAGALALAVAAPYAVLSAVVAALARTPQVQPVSWEALLGGLLVGGIGTLLGIARATGLWRLVPALLRDRGTRLVVGTSAALGVLVAGGAVLTGISLLAHLGRAGDLAAASAPGLVGGLALLLLGLLLVPNAVLWGSAWLAGPGFAVGVGTAVSPFGTSLGPVPALPLLAALPGAVAAWVGALGLLVPVAGGVLAGLLVVRRLDAPTWLVAAREAALVGPCAGAVLAVLCWASGGPAGGARLTDVGPSPWQVGLAVTLEVAVGAAAAAVVRVRR
ncbi:MAG: DUF6350 family protein [Actinobacteria bacterium]|nr:DUF6350 family protein [Actinomycetota bacterium]MCA1721848.1 DUF6350 family protein [Actinomycetota bacterium]